MSNKTFARTAKIALAGLALSTSVAACNMSGEKHSCSKNGCSSKHSCSKNGCSSKHSCSKNGCSSKK